MSAAGAVVAAALAAASGQTLPPLPIVVVDRDNVPITFSCAIELRRDVIADADGNGVVHILAPDISVDFQDVHLRGAGADAAPDTFSGTGVRITAGGVRVRRLKVSGYKAGIWATGADGLLVEACDVSDNFRQRLRSSPRAEDGGDWLWPHANDGNEWLTNYGAGLYVEDSAEVTVRAVRARRGQNGIMLDRANRSRVVDCDCSFMSGWGLALWRSSQNLISRNAFDFCVRGYSHGVYNRGQDSAGILLFEQCSHNVIVENSATHGGDGLFGFAGREALGEIERRDDPSWYRGRGNTRNMIIDNDFSDAAAHGIEMTFSYGNMIWRNRLAGNAICGVWAGYSQNTLIAGNRIESNGAAGYGSERGGVNIEHGQNNRIVHNHFAANPCGVFLWWDEDEPLMALPWAAANGAASSGTRIQLNVFEGDQVAVQLRRTSETWLGPNTMQGVGRDLDADEESRATAQVLDSYRGVGPEPPPCQREGENRPVGARAALAGREQIVMTEWGPYDWESPLLLRVEDDADRHVYRLLGVDGAAPPEAAVEGGGEVRVEQSGGCLVVRTDSRGAAAPYVLRVKAGGAELEARGVLLPLQWSVRVFPWQTDPRADEAAWRREAEARAVEASVGRLALPYAMGGPSQLEILGSAVADAALPADRFGTMARAAVHLPEGTWTLRTRSDDGIRLWLDEAVAIDDWTWHAPKEHRQELSAGPGGRDLTIRVEHFELDGYAVLEVDLERGP